MRKEIIWTLLGFAAFAALGFTFSSPGNDGWTSGEAVGAVHMNEIDSALDALEAGTSITALDPDVITGDTVDDNLLDIAAGGTGASTASGARTSLGLVINTDVMGVTASLTDLADGTITTNFTNTDNPWADDEVSNTLTASLFEGSGSVTTAIDLNTAETAGTLPVSKGGTGAGTFTATAVLKGAGAGPIAASGVTIDGSNNLDVQGNLTTGTTGMGCLILADNDAGGYTACTVLNGVWDCEIDTDGICDNGT